MTLKPSRRRLRTNRHKDPKIQKKYEEAVAEELKQLDWEQLDLEAAYEHLKNALIMAGEKILGST